MELLFGLIVIVLPLAVGVWLIGRALGSSTEIAELRRRQARLEDDFLKLRESLGRQPPPEVAPPPSGVAAARPRARAELAVAEETTASLAKRVEPPVPPPVSPREAETIAPPPSPPPHPEPARIPPAAARSPAPPPSPPRSSIDWEKFVGVKLFMWIGGLTAFLTVVLTVKYSFERNWITPELRVAAGFLAGLGLLVAGTVLHRRQRYLVGAQTFCATGIVILYATAFACHAIYHFAFFGLIPTFVLMALITATAFLLAVRLDALVVAVLGILGGFLTPLLLATGEDNPFGLFGYIALLDAGLIAVALRKQWKFLTLLGAVGTLLMQMGWIAEFFVREAYFADDKVLIALGVFLGFSTFFAAIWARVQRRRQGDSWLTGATVLLAVSALFFAFYLMTFEPLGQRPGLVFGYIVLVDLCLLGLAWLDEQLDFLQVVAGVMVFLLLAEWTAQHLDMALLYWGLVLYLVFAILHAALPFVFQRRRRVTTPPLRGQVPPLLALLLMLLVIFKLHSATLGLWPFVLLVDLLVFALAAISASLLGVLAALGLTLLLAATWIAQAPGQVDALPESLLVTTAVAAFFFAGGVLLARRLATRHAQPAPDSGVAGQASWEFLGFAPNTLLPLVPALSALLPFLLLIMLSLRLPIADPSPLFGLALLLIVLLLGLTRLYPVPWLPALGLFSILALEHVWHLEHFSADRAVTPLLWYLGFTLLLAGFPFLFRQRLGGQIVPWATAALAGPLHYYLVHRLVQTTWPNEVMGLLPLAFALPSVFALIFLVRSLGSDAPRRMTILAFFAGATLFFVTLVFPVQFDRQWITLGWALEGTALLWLNRRLPHNGLRLTGLGLLVTAFVRLAANPAVLEYHTRAATAILNWYLYAYGLTALCLFLGARFLTMPGKPAQDREARASLAALGTVLLFVLLNIEIADYFTAPGAVALTFEFSGNLARDMTYSIAWATFALVLLGVGIRTTNRFVRYAGIGLLGVTLAKLFFHDLANLEALYRIGALFGMAIAAIAASFLYQRFFATDRMSAESGTEAHPPPPAA